MESRILNILAARAQKAARSKNEIKKTLEFRKEFRRQAEKDRKREENEAMRKALPPQGKNLSTRTRKRRTEEYSRRITAGNAKARGSSRVNRHPDPRDHRNGRLIIGSGKRRAADQKLSSESLGAFDDGTIAEGANAGWREMAEFEAKAAKVDEIKDKKEKVAKLKQWQSELDAQIVDERNRKLQERNSARLWAAGEAQKQREFEQQQRQEAKEKRHRNAELRAERRQDEKDLQERALIRHKKKLKAEQRIVSRAKAELAMAQRIKKEKARELALKNAEMKMAAAQQAREKKERRYQEHLEDLEFNRQYKLEMDRREEARAQQLKEMYALQEQLLDLGKFTQESQAALAAKDQERQEREFVRKNKQLDQAAKDRERKKNLDKLDLKKRLSEQIAARKVLALEDHHDDLLRSRKIRQQQVAHNRKQREKEAIRLAANHEYRRDLQKQKACDMLKKRIDRNDQHMHAFERVFNSDFLQTPARKFPQHKNVLRIVG